MEALTQYAKQHNITVDQLSESYPLDPEVLGYLELGIALNNLARLKTLLEQTTLDPQQAGCVDLIRIPLQCLRNAQQQLSTLMTRENLQ